jgi:GntR family transcriptional regulator, transcriptional repressor for pyruvate dehydrogenase complex
VDERSTVALEPIERRSLPDEVVDRLLAEIVAGSFDVGEVLPSERRLAEALGVSRPAVREALSRLSATGLVDTRHGGGTTVTDYRRSAGLDLLPSLLLAGGELDLSVARSLIEVRAAVGPHVARLAATRATPEGLAAIEACLDDLDRAAGDPVALQHAALDFWDAVVDAADNIAFRLMYNALRAAYEPTIEALARVLVREVSDHDAYVAVAGAIADGRPAAAAAATVRLLDRGTRAVLAVLDDLLAEHPDEPVPTDRERAR